MLILRRSKACKLMCQPSVISLGVGLTILTINKMKKSKRDFITIYNGIRKPMPPSEKVINPKNRYEDDEEHFDWRKELEEQEKEDQEFRDSRFQEEW